MKTIEERAKEAWDNYEYREGELYQNCFTDGFVAGAKYEQDHRPITLPEYQLRAMSTCLPSCNNFSYMMLNLVGEVGELASKVAKAIRKGEATITGDQLRHPSTRRIDNELEEAMKLESGDVLWQLAGLCSVMGWDLEEVARMNLDKLASRKQRGEYDHIEDNIEMVGRIIPYRDVTNQVELITPFDDDYWRKLYAGMAMQGFCRENVTMNPASMVANVSVEYADALIAELKKTK